MARILSFIKTLRNNWKKSVFGCVVITYGVHYAKGKYECKLLMTEYCNEALKYGNLPHLIGSKFRNVTVFLNPAANKRKAKKDFDKYCAPLLYLAGFSVTVVQTKFQGEARSLAEKLDDNVDAVIVAGGDGTLSEIVTGLLRRENGNNPLHRRVPVGILPLGRINAVAKSLFSENGKEEIKMMAEATMAVIREVKKPVDVIKIEQLEKEGEDRRPIYSVSGLKWGAVYDAYAKRDKYWYWGALREYITYIFMGLKLDGKGVTWNCNANLHFTLPCSGCYECYHTQEPVKQKTVSRWWQSFVPKQPSTLATQSQKIDYSKIKNDACTKFHDIDISSVDLILETSDKNQEGKIEPEIPHLKISIGPPSVSYWDFIQRGWQYIKGNKIQSSSTLHVKEVKLLPNNTITQGLEHLFYIDNDDYEVKPIYIKLLPKRIVMFCQQQVPNS